MAGRKPKPTNLKKILGNPGHRDLPAGEIKPDGIPQKPRFLKSRASKIWDEYAPKLTKLGVLTDVDSATFAAWCCLAAEFESDSERMTASRIAQMRALASSFGMDASSRARMGVKDGEETKDPADKYFGAAATFRPGNEICN